LDDTAVGKEVITTEDGSESATAKIYGVAQLEERRGIIIASFDTNSTGRLAPLDGMILAGQIEYLQRKISPLSRCGSGRVGDHYRLLLQAVVYHNYKESVLNHALLLCPYEKISYSS
jgi:hypothetical protein